MCHSRAFALFAALCVILSAQTSPVISVSTRLIQFSVVAHDKHGNPVTDLTAKDFEITDNGRTYPVSIFTVEDSNSPQTVKPSVPPQPNTVSNRPAVNGVVPPNLTVILMDAYNTKFADQMYMRREMLRFFKDMGPGDPVALYALTGGASSGFRVLHDFTANREDLLQAVNKLMPSFSSATEASNPDAANTGDNDLDAVIDQAAYAEANFASRIRVVNTSQAFIALAEHLKSIPGRKNLVWVSGGFPLDIGFGDPEDVSAEKQAMGGLANDQDTLIDYVERASVQLNNANIAVYPVDVRGLLAAGIGDASRNFKVNRQTGQLPQAALSVDQRPVLAMEYIAELTGGKAYHDRNDIDGAVREAINDSSLTYLIGYYLPDDGWDGKFHKIKISIKRKGVHIRTKKGYLAKDPPTPTAKQADDILRETLWSPLESATLSLTAHADGPNPGTGLTAFSYSLDPAELHLPEKDGTHQGIIDILVTQEGPHHKILDSTKKEITLDLRADTYKRLLQSGLNLTQNVQVNPAAESVRIVVLNRDDGDTGSVTIPIQRAN